MSSIALILAAGNAVRMNGIKKQLLSLRYTTILGRILDQMNEYDQLAFLITHDKEIGLHHDLVYCPENRKTTCDSLLSTRSLWEERTIVLLGDVVYSGDVMKEIMTCREPIKIFGNAAEIFAVVFCKEVWDKVIEALEQGRKTNYGNRGKLRYFFYAYCDYLPGMGEDEPLDNNEIFFRTHDWTRDIDTMTEYYRAQLEIVDTRVVEELPV